MPTYIKNKVVQGKDKEHIPSSVVPGQVNWMKKAHTLWWNDS